jgi:flagellar biosynthetic protein FlhB
MSEDDGQEKQHEATQKRIDDSRVRGEIARSQDMLAAFSLMGFAISFFIFGWATINQFGTKSRTLWADVGKLTTKSVFDDPVLVGTMLSGLTLAFLPLFLLPPIAAILSLLVQKAVLFTPENLLPKWSRISPMAALKNKFGFVGLLDFFKNLAKSIIVTFVLGFLLVDNLSKIMGSLYQTVGGASVLMFEVAMDFLIAAVVISLLFGAIDYALKIFEHQKKNRMSRQEVQDEHKESEGDPNTKAQRRQMGQEIAMNQMLGEVAKADVVIVNPTHFAVALKWDKSSRAAPVVVAKGVDEMAAKIRALAREASVPIQSDPPAARMIYATVKLGESVLPEHYKAVAVAIRFAEALQKRKSRS